MRLHTLHRTLLAPGLILLLLAGSMLFPLPPRAARAQDVCGDGVCSTLEKEAGCSKDCGAFRGYCGNGVCERNENCRTCAEDCGWCSTDTETEKVIEEAGVPQSLCGDSVCSPSEECSRCPGDCGACPSTWQGKLLYQFRRTVRLVRHFLWKSGSLLTVQSRRVLRDTLAYLEKQQSILQENAVERSRAAQKLDTLFDKYPDLAGGLSVFQKRLIERVSQEDRAGILNGIPSMFVTQATQRVVRSESRRVTRLMSTLLQHPAMREQLREPHTFDALVEAVDEEDLQQAVSLLPPPRYSLQQLTQQLDLLETLLQEQPGTSARSSLLWEEALAQGKKEPPNDPKAEFERALMQLQNMRALASNPQEQATLDERLAYLMERRKVLAGIVHLPEEGVAKLGEVQKGARTTSVQQLINFVGIFRYIRSTANFQALEGTLQDTLFRMRSGIGNIRAFFMHGVSPRAEAEELLLQRSAEAAVAFAGEDFAKQKEVTRELLTEQKAGLQQILAQVSAEEQKAFEKKFIVVQAMVEASPHPTALRFAVEEWETAVRELQGAARTKRNIFLRFIYTFQDFFGFTS